jgi:hypothetical protein
LIYFLQDFIMVLAITEFESSIYQVNNYFIAFYIFTISYRVL